MHNTQLRKKLSEAVEFLAHAALDCSAEAQLPVILSTLQLFRKEASETEEACCKLCQRHRAIQRFAGHKDGCRSFTWQHDTRDCLLFNPQRNNTASA
jgi:hypothetical protein